DKPSHRLPATLNHAAVAIGLVNGPGTDDAGITPGGAKIPTMLEWIGSVAGKDTAGALRFHKLSQPLGVERGDVGIESGSSHIDLSVTGPTEALISLRTIGRKIQKISALRPNNIFEKAIHKRVGALEIAGKTRFRVHDNARNGIQIRCARIASQFHIWETVESEAGDEGFPERIAAQDVGVSSTGFAEVFGHQTAIGMQHLTVTKANLDAGRPFYFQGHDTRKILAEIENVNAVCWGGDGERFDLLDSLDGHAGKRLEPRRWLEAKVYLSPLDFYFLPRTRILIFVEGRLYRMIVFGADRAFPFAVIKTSARPT